MGLNIRPARINFIRGDYPAAVRLPPDVFIKRRRFRLTLLEAMSLAARGQPAILKSAATFFFGLMLADTPLRAGLALAAASQAGCALAEAAGS